MIALFLLACGNPLANDPPVLESVNGVPPESRRSFEIFLPDEAVDFELVLEVSDPEGHGVRIWFPWAPPGLDFPEDGTTGVWHLAEAQDVLMDRSLYVVLEDTSREPARSDWHIWVQGGPFTAFDTGF